MHKIQRYGWVADLPDRRDFRYSAPHRLRGVLPPSADLRSQMPPVYDQGQLGSCTANSIGGAFHFEELKQKEAAFMPSRLMIYYNERAMERTINSDSGAQIRDGIKSVVSLGVCSEDMWAYDPYKFTIRPPANCYVEAKKHLVTSYMRVNQNLDDIRGCLAEGYPIAFGFTVYAGFENDTTAQTGILQMPAASEECMGGHAVLCVGYDDASQRVIVRNSWGDSWGKNGYFTMPYSYITDDNLADDLWTIRLVE